MKLPERNWYTVEILAKEWSCTAEYIEHLLETRKMNATTRKGIIGDNDALLEELIGDKSRYISRFVALPKGQKSFPAGTELIIETAEVRRMELECGIGDKSDGKQTSMKDHPKITDGLLKMVIAMAIDCYGYDPSNSKNTAVADIIKALEERGLSLSENTIRQRLKEGFDLIPRKENE